MPSNRQFSRTVKMGRKISRWFFVVVTWLILVVLLWDFWRFFERLTVQFFLRSSLPVLAGLITLAVLLVTAMFEAEWLLKLIICMLFFLSIAVLYSYVGYELTYTLQNAIDRSQTNSLSRKKSPSGW
ncbi:MAG: hypothetical protein ABEK50_19025 [bacterium]